MKYCSIECRTEAYKIKVTKAREAKLATKAHVTCEICGTKATSLSYHIFKLHGLNIQEYMEKYNKTLDQVILPEVRKSWGDKIKGKANGASNHGGLYSPYSLKFTGYDGLSNEEKARKIKALHVKQSQSKKVNQKSPNQVGYWLKLGYTEDEAIAKVSDSQRTFTKEKCIEKYGKVEGIKRWKARQDGWQATLKAKPLEEQERINRSKFGDTGYSKISQKLFWKLYEILKEEYIGIEFAEHGVSNQFGNGEHAIYDGRGFMFLDFLVLDNKKVIEFDGDYWHGEKRGNQRREAQRNQRIMDQGYQLLHVTEKSYTGDPGKTVQECVDWIRSS